MSAESAELALRPGTAGEPSLDQLIATSLGRRDALIRRLLAIADVLGVAASLAIASLVVGAREDPLSLFLLGLPTLPVWVLLFKLYGLYDRDIKRISHSTLDDLPWLFHALVIGGLLMWGYFKLLLAQETTSPAQLSVAEGATFGVSALLLISVLRWAARRMTLGILGAERVLVAGEGAMIAPLVRKMNTHPEYGLDPIGLVTPETGRPGTGGLDAVGDVRDLPRIIPERVVERLVICRQDFSERQVMDMIQVCRAMTVKVSLLPAVFDALGPSVEIDEVEGVTVLGVNPPVLSRTSWLIKRSFDLVVASMMSLVFLPIFVIVAVAIKLDSRGPVLFRQERIGRGGRRFKLLKFRTMCIDAEERRATLLAHSRDPNWLHLERDPRVTRVGRILRILSIDELPQLWNVLRGEMSLVGPRPLIEEEDRRIAGWMRGRLDLMPGITGLWQVLGRTSIPFEEMVKLDYLYVSNWSLWFDIRLLVRTLPVVLSRRGAN